MRFHIRLFLPLVTLLALCLASSGPRSPLTRDHPAGQPAEKAQATAAHDHSKANPGESKVLRNHDAMVTDGAPGESFDSEDDVQLPASNVTNSRMFARVFGEGIETPEAAHGFSIEGLPESNPVAEELSALLMPGQTFDVDVGPGGTQTFEPDELTINVGDTVRWTWRSPTHTVTSGPGCTADSQFCSPSNNSCPTGATSSTGFVYSRTFNTPGSYTYFCRTHCTAYNMRGTITVQGAASTFSISGKVATGGGAAVSGVTMTLSGASSATATTDASGNYSFSNLAAGNYTVTPSLTNHTFTPASRSYANLSANQTAQNFTATATTSAFSIGGTVRVGTTGLGGVTMTLTSPTPAGFTPRTVMTTSAGAYTLTNVPAGRNYTLTPTKTNYTFKNTSNTAQASRTYTNLSANQTAQDFAATLKLYSIGGTVRLGSGGLASVTMTLKSPSPAGFTPRIVTTTSAGVYKFLNVPAGRNYTLTPTKSNYTFKNTSNTAQAFRSYTNLSANQTAQDFAATLKLYTISGRVTLSDGTTGIQGVTMTLSSPTPAGFTPRTATTASTGNYSFASVPGARNYTLKPTKTGHTFSPTQRTFNNLSANQTGAATAFTGTPPAPLGSAFEFGEASYRADEGDGSFEVTVKRAGDLSAPASVDYAVDDGTAQERSDYSTTLGTLHFAPGEAARSFTVFLTDDAFAEGDETVKLTIADVAVGALTSNRSKTAVLTINDNDSGPASTNPIDDPAFFVRQLYVDFLAREPRAEESAALVSGLNQCAAGDLGCDRTAVAAGVLRSDEFRRRGYFLFRLYSVALGRAPFYREFVRDLRQLEAAGGEPNAGRESFVDEWVKRSPEFEERHGALSDAAYVDQLSRAASSPSTTRDAALGDLERGSKTRAQVLLELVEAKELPRRFVESASFAALHFGLLRREPNAGDALTLQGLLSPDPQGQRELIRALITSAEYRSRFGRP